MAEDNIEKILGEDIISEEPQEQSPQEQVQEETPPQETAPQETAPQEAEEEQQVEEVNDEEVRVISFEEEEESEQQVSFEDQFKETFGLTVQEAKQKMFGQPETSNDPSDAMAKRFGEYIKKGISPAQAARLLSGVDKMSDIELIKFDYKINKPSLSDKHIDSLINKEYRISEMEDLTEEERTAAEAQLISHADDIRKKLGGIQKEVEDYQQEQVQNQEKYQKERLQKWEKTLPDMLKKFEHLEVSIDKDTKLKYAVTNSQKNELARDLMQFVNSTGISADDEQGLQAAERVMRDRYKVLYFDKLVGAVAKKAATKQAEQHDEESHNPYSSKSRQQQVSPAEKDLADQIAEVEGLRLR